jgi:hypothetical protein
MAIDSNLEIIVDADQKILAYRHDPPEDMNWMVINAGHWQLHDEDFLEESIIQIVRGIIVNLRVGGSLN